MVLVSCTTQQFEDGRTNLRARFRRDGSATHGMMSLTLEVEFPSSLPGPPDHTAYELLATVSAAAHQGFGPPRRG